MNGRRGAILFDALVATALLAVLFAFSLRAVAAIAAGRHANEQRAIAVQVATGALERAAATSWNDLTAETLASLVRQHPIDQSLPGATMTLSVSDQETAGDVAQRRLCAEVSWPNSTASARPIKLYRWIYHAAEVAP